MSLWHLLVLLLLLGIAGGATAILWVVGRGAPDGPQDDSGRRRDRPH